MNIIVEIKLTTCILVSTWSHTGMNNQTNEQIASELYWTAQAVQDVIGVTPTLVRPPYGEANDRVRTLLNGMGFSIVNWVSFPMSMSL